MAAVFLAHDLALNRKVAIKVMAPGLLMGEGMIDRFRQEAVTIANLQHANIVTVHAVRQLQDLQFFVMQYIEGQSLEAVLRHHHALPLDIARPILYQVGTALAYAHRRGVIHRDIKPGNVLLSSDGDALVTDFGIAKVAAAPSHTVTGMVIGTPAYMSPEQCHAGELDGRSDQYSLGIVAYHMLTGGVPFSGSPISIMTGHIGQSVPSIRAVMPAIPESVERTILRMLAKSPTDRFPSIPEALQSLEAYPVGDDSQVRAVIVHLAAEQEPRAALGDPLRPPVIPIPLPRPVADTPSAPPVREAEAIEASAVKDIWHGGRQVAQAPAVKAATDSSPPKSRAAGPKTVDPRTAPVKRHPLVAIGGGVLGAVVGGWALLRGEPAVERERASSTVTSDTAAPRRAVPSNKAVIAAVTTPVRETTTIGQTRLVVNRGSEGELRPSQRVQLHTWVQSLVTGGPVNAAISFTTSDSSVAVVDPVTRMVTAIAPGRAFITVDAGEAGRRRVDIVVRVAGGGGAPLVTTITQAQLASEARAVVESLARAHETLDLRLIRNRFPAVVAEEDVAELSDSVKTLKSVRIRVQGVSINGSGDYDATVGSHTDIEANVTMRLVPVRGSPTSREERWLITLQRTKTGWRVIEFGTT